MARVLASTMCVAALTSVPLTPGAAQQVDSARVGARRPATPTRAPAAPDTAKPPVSPKRAFLYSLMLPGYGQSVLDRPIAGAVFFSAEVTWIALATKSAVDLRFARAHEKDSLVVAYAFDADGKVRTDSLGRLVGATYAPNRYATARVQARRKHLEDYFALLIATHLLAGAEAFVSAQLWDLPEHVSMRALPFGAANDPDGGPGGASATDPSNEHPNPHDYQQLQTIYAHLDSTSTVGQTTNQGAPGLGVGNQLDRGQFGQLIRSTNGGRTQLFVLDLGNGERVFTHVVWAE